MLDCFLIIIAILLLFNLYLIIKSDDVLDYIISAIILFIISYLLR